MVRAGQWLKDGLVRWASLLRSGFDRCLGGGETGDRNAIWRTANVGQASVVAELDGCGVASMLSTDAQLDVRIRGLSTVDALLNQ